MANNDPYAYLSEEEILRIRLDEQDAAARSRHDDYDEVLGRVTDWTDEQKREAFDSSMLRDASGDFAEHVYSKIREKTDFRPVSDEQFYDGEGDSPDVGEKLDPKSDEAIYGD